MGSFLGFRRSSFPYSFFCSSFRREPESILPFFPLVIPAKAGIQFLRSSSCLSSSARASTQLRCAGNFLCLCKEVTKETHPRWRGLRASLPSDFASVLRRFADGTSLCPQRTGAHPARHPAGFFLRTLAAPQGAPLGRHPAAEARARAAARTCLASRPTFSLTQCRDARIRGSTRRSRCRASQALRRKARRGAAMDRRACAAVHGRTVCATPQCREAQGILPRTRRGKTPRWALAFLVTFWAMPKSNPLAAGERKLCSREQSRRREQGTGFRLTPE